MRSLSLIESKQKNYYEAKTYLEIGKSVQNGKNYRCSISEIKLELDFNNYDQAYKLSTEFLNQINKPGFEPFIAFVLSVRTQVSVFYATQNANTARNANIHLSIFKNFLDENSKYNTEKYKDLIIDSEKELNKKRYKFNI